MSKSIKKIKIKDYFKLDYKFLYDLAEDLTPPKNLFNDKVCEFMKLTFDEMEWVKNIVIEPTIENIKDLYEICYNETNFLNCRLLDYFQSKKWIDKQIIELVKTEKKLLYIIPNPKKLAAGADNLKMFKSLNTKNAFGAMYGFRPKEIGKWKYEEVLYLQALHCGIQNINTNLSQMK